MIHKNGGDAQRQDLVRTPAREEFDADDAVYVELPNVFFQRFQIGIGAEYILQHFERAPLRLGHDAADEIDIVVCRNQRNGGEDQNFSLLGGALFGSDHVETLITHTHGGIQYEPARLCGHVFAVERFGNGVARKMQRAGDVVECDGFFHLILLFSIIS